MARRYKTGQFHNFQYKNRISNGLLLTESFIVKHERTMVELGLYSVKW